MTDIGNVLTLLISLIAALTSAYALVSQRRKTRSEVTRIDIDADAIKNSIMREVLATAQAEMDRRDTRIAELEKSVVGITAKLAIETSLYVAVQKALDLATVRISALEAELLKRDGRIIELEMLTRWVRENGYNQEKINATITPSSNR